MARTRDRIPQTGTFSCAEQEAFLSIGRTWAVLEHAFAEALKPYGITATQYNVLRILRGAGADGLCRAEVMQRMIAKVPDATRLLDRLETAGLIERRRETSDRRYVTTRLTDRGLELLTTLDEPVRALHERHFGWMRTAELRELIALHERIRAGL